MAKVFVLAGQSNMEGAGAVADLPARWREPSPAKLFERGAWRDLLWRETFGPEVGFVAELLAGGDEPAPVLVKHATGGTNLAYDWNPDGVSRAAEYKYLGPMYPRLLDAVEAARADLASSGESFEPAGLLWMQGERDSVYEPMAVAYEANLKAFIETVRRDLGVADLPVVIGRVAPRVYRIEDETFMHGRREIVRQAQRRVADADARAAWIESIDLPQFDNLHFDAGGQIELGRRFARAYRSIVAG